MAFFFFQPHNSVRLFLVQHALPALYAQHALFAQLSLRAIHTLLYQQFFTVSLVTVTFYNYFTEHLLLSLLCSDKITLRGNPHV